VIIENNIVRGATEGRGNMGDETIRIAVFVLPAVIGVATLLLLHRSTLNAAIRRAIKPLRLENARLASEIDQANSKISEQDEHIEKADTEVRRLRDFEDIRNGLEARLEQMEAVWLSSASSEAECQEVLGRNLWLLAPEYIVKENFFTSPKWLISVFRDHFDGVDVDWNAQKYKIRVPHNFEPDMCGWATSQTGFYQTSQDVYILIELKAPSVSLSWTAIEQVHAYAFGLMQNVESLRKSRVDCLVIGGDCPEELNDAHLRWGADAHHAINIFPMSYGQLYERACKIAEPFLSPSMTKLDAPVPGTDRPDTSALPNGSPDRAYLVTEVVSEAGPELETVGH